MKLPKAVVNLISQFERLPGIGPKTSQRLTYHFLYAPAEIAQNLASALLELKEKTTTCQTCFNITESSPCDICSSSERAREILMVVEEPLDVLALEASRSFDGLYHVLGGVITPLQNVGPDDLRIKELLSRLKGDSVKEVILATNPTLEGEATALYLRKQISFLRIKTTRIARGLPVGGDLEYADQVTLMRAVEGRREF